MRAVSALEKLRWTFQSDEKACDVSREANAREVRSRAQGPV